MALFDIFKKKKKQLKKKAEKTVEIKPRPVKPKPPLKPKKVSGAAAKVLKKPQVTEKATDLVGKDQYVFRVESASNKNEIKQAVEELYGVNVLNVKIINIPRKARRLGKVEGWRQGYKKAIVKIEHGQKIEVLPR